MPLPGGTVVVPGSVDAPITSSDDVRALYPATAQGNNDAAPVREAMTEAMTSIQLAHQDKAEYAAAQADVTRSTGIYLDGLLGDRTMVRADGEADADYRARGLGVQSVVSPTAILERVNAILAAYTTIEAQLFDSILDRTFIGAGSRPYAFIGTGEHAIDPDYPDRYYADRPNRRPGGAWVFRDTAKGRLFVVRVPVLFGLEGTFVFGGGHDESADGAVGGAFIGDGSHASIAATLTTGAETALQIYQTIANAIAAIKGQGVRVILYADPLLTA